jgi:lactoylglutathione lyase
MSQITTREGPLRTLLVTTLAVLCLASGAGLGKDNSSSDSNSDKGCRRQDVPAVVIGGTPVIITPDGQPPQPLNGLVPRISGAGFNLPDQQTLDRSVAFYTGVLGMHEVQRILFGENFTEVLLRYGDTDTYPNVVLSTRSDGSPAAYERLVLAVPDVRATVRQLKHESPAAVVAGPFVEPSSGTVIALARDPDGFPLELFQYPNRTNGCGRPDKGIPSPPGWPATGPLGTVPRIVGTGYFVADMNRAVDFYTRVLDMGVFLDLSGEGGFGEVLVTYGKPGDTDAPNVVLVRDGEHRGYHRLVLTVPDVTGLVNEVVAAGGTVEVPPFQVPGYNALIALVRDPNGFLIELIQQAVPSN